MDPALEGHVLFSFHLANSPVNICSQDQKLSWNVCKHIECQENMADDEKAMM